MGERVLEPKDVVVVAPYNAQVRCLRAAIPDERIRIGTVDKFQGQEAPVVFYSMASSSGEDVPRGLDFLFSRNRLNVAISRAKCLAYLVASPRLLDANCRTVEQMRLANALCRFVEAPRSSAAALQPMKRRTVREISLTSGGALNRRTADVEALILEADQLPERDDWRTLRQSALTGSCLKHWTTVQGLNPNPTRQVLRACR